MLADDVEPGVGQQMVDVGDAAGDRIFDRDHRQRRLSVAHGGKRVLERAQGKVVM